MEKKRGYSSNRKTFLTLIIILFLIYAYDFFTQKGYESNIATTLFKMIIILFLIFTVVHKNELKEMVYRQTYLEDYFNKVK